MLHYGNYYHYSFDDSLHRAIKRRVGLSNLSNMLKCKLLVNTVDSDGHSPLHVACAVKSVNQLKIIEMLLYHKANINYVDHHLETPLFIACRGENLEIIKTLINNGANLHAKDKKGRTPLHAACESKSNMTRSIIQYLLEHGANVDAVDVKKWTPLFVSCKEGNLTAVRCLVDNYANLHAKNDECQTLLHITSEYWHNLSPGIVKLLVQHNVNINSVDQKGLTPLLRAGEKNCYKAAKCLLKNHANANVTNEKGQTPLHLVCKWHLENTDTIQVLLEYGANIDAVDYHGWTPLFFASNYNNYKTIQLLLEHHANPNHTDLKKLTPLHVCVRKAFGQKYGHCKPHLSVQLLIKYGADINALDKDNLSPLHIAIQEMMAYFCNESDFIVELWKNYETMIKILAAQGIKLKTAGLEVINHNTNGVYKPNDFILIENVRYPMLDFLQFNVAYDSDSMLHEAYRVVQKKDSIDDLRNLKNRCEQEIEMMKESIGIDDFTFYDFLKGNIRFLSQLTENEKFQQILETEIYNDKFPLYIDIIRNRLRDAKIYYDRYMLKMSAIECFALNICNRLPDECIEKVLNYLNIEEVKIFVKAIQQ